MNIRYGIIYIISTLIRFFPFPGKTGLVTLGKPGKTSPVFLTGNFQLTIEVVKKALKGIDCYLLVANSKGINIWCAATGGHLNNHSVISVIKTSGIDRLVDHQHIILPQLAATGIERDVIREKTGWKILWGPIDAKDIPQFLESNSITIDKRRVEFPIFARLEMAVAWIFILLLVNTLIFVWGEYLFITTLIVTIPVLIIYVFLPLFIEWLIRSPRRGILNPRLLIIQILTWLLIFPLLYLYNITHDGNGFLWQVLYLLGIIMVACVDLFGSTPLYKSNLHHQYTIELDDDLCKGAAFCEVVCPKGCFEIEEKKAILDPTECVQCGACIIQCPFDALHFVSEGTIIPPEQIRKYKLNMMGERMVKQ